MQTMFQKLVTGILIATLGLAGLPLGSAHAAASGDAPTPTPAAASPERSAARLERAFARETRRVAGLGELYGHAGQGFPKAEKLLDKAKARGLDVSAIEAALKAFEDALPKGRASYDQAKALADGHNGFDASGHVTNAATARATVESLHTALQGFQTAMNGSGKALHQAIRDFRQAHPHPGH